MQKVLVTHQGSTVGFIFVEDTATIWSLDNEIQRVFNMNHLECEWYPID